jgi:hypothetical protein
MIPYIFAHILSRFKEEWPSPLKVRERERAENMLRIGSDAKNDELDENLVDGEHVVN